jgi:4-amino-4-deoxy-L-arabinose transferase-like glycosyltransferase
LTPRAEKIGAALIVIASFLLFSLYSVLTPLYEASDELWHYPMVQHLATGGGLPIQRKDQTDADAPWRQEGSQPPLYYWIAAAFSAPFDSSNWRELRRINPHSDMGVPTRDGNANAILHTPAEQFPWNRAALATRMARLVSILMSTTTVLFSYLVARELFGRREDGDARAPLSTHNALPLLRLAVPLLVACVPMFAFISGAINNDNAAVMFSTIGMWWALRLMRLGDLSWKSAVFAGALAGLGALSKSSTMGLIGLFGLAALLSRFKSQEPRTKTFRSWLLNLGAWFFLLLAVTLIISGWWFIRNVQLYGDVLGWNAFLDVVGRRDMPASLAQLWTEREGFVWAFWGVFGTLNVIMHPAVYDVLNALFIVAMIGCVYGLASSIFQKRITRHELRIIVLCAFWVALVFVALLRWTSLTPASQGRLLFPCISVIAAAMAYGLWRIHRFLLMGVCAGFVALAVAVPFVYVAPAYAMPASQWQARLPVPVNATFGNALSLVEAESSAQTAQPGDEVTLRMNWQLTQPLPANYSVFVHLIDENDVIVAQRDMYPGQGNIATAETPADYRWTDHYTLRIPALAPAPRNLRWAVGAYNFQTGERLTLPNGNDRAIFGAFQLAERTDASPLLRYANGVELIDYTIAPSALRPGEALSVTLRWRTTQPIAQDLNLSLQLLDDQANKIAQQDQGQPLTQWTPGEIYETTFTLQTNADAPAGVYDLLAVWYDPNGFARTPAYDARGQFAGDQIRLTRIRVK